MELRRVPSQKASRRLPILPTDERALETRESAAGKIIVEISAEPTKPVKLRPAQGKSWWPAACRGIVG
jgi:hypothetical protein